MSRQGRPILRMAKEGARSSAGGMRNASRRKRRYTTYERSRRDHAAAVTRKDGRREAIRSKQRSCPDSRRPAKSGRSAPSTIEAVTDRIGTRRHPWMWAKQDRQHRRRRGSRCPEPSPQLDHGSGLRSGSPPCAGSLRTSNQPMDEIKSLAQQRRGRWTSPFPAAVPGSRGCLVSDQTGSDAATVARQLQPPFHQRRLSAADTQYNKPPAHDTAGSLGPPWRRITRARYARRSSSRRGRAGRLALMEIFANDPLVWIVGVARYQSCKAPGPGIRRLRHLRFTCHYRKPKTKGPSGHRCVGESGGRRISARHPSHGSPIEAPAPNSWAADRSPHPATADIEKALNKYQSPVPDFTFKRVPRSRKNALHCLRNS